MEIIKIYVTLSSWGWTDLERQNAEEMWPPNKLEPDRCDLGPRRTVLCHLPSSDTDQGLNTVPQAGGALQGLRIDQLAVKQSAETKVVSIRSRKQLLYTTYVSSQNSAIRATTMAL